MKKTYMFTFIFILGLSLLSGCTNFKNSKKYEMKKSPCACFEEVDFLYKS
ncbi:hypothetical protein [Helicobacter sp. 10-6591]|nr:hypothetical protein [Helicobacter sp. 10-6591]MCI7484354.1 hypothetical protein [Helicobacter sp.]